MMAIQNLDNFNLLLQIMQATRNLAWSMRDNAAQWNAWASSQSIPVATLAQFMNDAAASYLNIIAGANAFVTGNTSQVTNSLALISVTVADLNSYGAGLKTAAQNLEAADKSTYAACTTASNAVLAQVAAPASIYGV